MDCLEKENKILLQKIENIIDTTTQLIETQHQNEKLILEYFII